MAAPRINFVDAADVTPSGLTGEANADLTLDTSVDFANQISVLFGAERVAIRDCFCLGSFLNYLGVIDSADLIVCAGTMVFDNCSAYE